MSSNVVKVEADRMAKQKKEKQELFDKVLAAVLINSDPTNDYKDLVTLARAITELAYSEKRNIK